MLFDCTLPSFLCFFFFICPHTHPSTCMCIRPKSAEYPVPSSRDAPGCRSHSPWAAPLRSGWARNCLVALALPWKLYCTSSSYPAVTLGWPIENLHGGFGMVHPEPCTLTERDLCEREETEPTLTRLHQPGCGVCCRLLLSGGDALGASAGAVS